MSHVPEPEKIGRGHRDGAEWVRNDSMSDRAKPPGARNAQREKHGASCECSQCCGGKEY